MSRLQIDVTAPQSILVANAEEAALENQRKKGTDLSCFRASMSARRATEAGNFVELTR